MAGFIPLRWRHFDGLEPLQIRMQNNDDDHSPTTKKRYANYLRLCAAVQDSSRRLLGKVASSFIQHLQSSQDIARPEVS